MNPRKREKALIAACVACLVLLSCSQPLQTKNEEAPVLSARIAHVERTTFPVTFSAPGLVQARTSTVLSAKTTGQILMLSVREGDRVSAGQVLVEVDSRAVEAALRRARAAEAEARQSLEEIQRSILAAEAAAGAAKVQSDFARTTAERYASLRDRGSVSIHEFQQVEAASRGAEAESERAVQSLEASRAKRLQVLARIDQTKAEADSAAAIVGDSRTVAPISGIVTSRSAEVGVFAAPGMPLLGIEDDRRYELAVSVEEARIGQVQRGQAVRIDIETIGSTTEGFVSRIHPASATAARTYKVIVDIPSTENIPLRTGMFGRASFQTGKREGLVVPASAVVHRGQLTGVLVETNGVARFRLIQIGEHADGTTVEVAAGLDEGEPIITSAPVDVPDGARIERSAERRQP